MEKGIICYVTKDKEGWGKYLEINGERYNSEIKIITKKEGEKYKGIDNEKYDLIKPIKIKELFKAYNTIEYFEVEKEELEKFKRYSESNRIDNPILCWVGENEKEVEEKKKIAWIYSKCCYYGDKEYSYIGSYNDKHYKKIKPFTKKEIEELVINRLELNIYEETKMYGIKIYENLKNKESREKIKENLEKEKENLKKELEEYFSEKINQSLMLEEEYVEIKYQIDMNKYYIFFNIEEEIKEYFEKYLLRELEKEELIEKAEKIKSSEKEEKAEKIERKHIIKIKVKLKG